MLEAPGRRVGGKFHRLDGPLAVQAPHGLAERGGLVAQPAGARGQLVEPGGEVLLAPRREGMRLRLHLSRPRRELRKLCQEAGIPAWLRDRLPVLWVGGEPAWVGGIGVAVEFACVPGAPGLVPDWRPGGVPEAAPSD